MHTLLPVPIYQFHPWRIPQVQYPSWCGIKLRWVDAKSHIPTYGEALRAARLESRSYPGLCVLEHDVAVPAKAWMELAVAIERDRASVHTVPYVLYPASTGRPDNVWSVRVLGPAGGLPLIPVHDAIPNPADAFGLGCTYLPAALLDAMPEDLRQWDYPRLDSQLSELARRICLAIHVCDHQAVHLHY